MSRSLISRPAHFLPESEHFERADDRWVKLDQKVANDDVPVLIVGGSLVGLSAAVFLGHLGVPSLVLERHRGTAIHPRAALVNQRSDRGVSRGRACRQEIEEAAATEFVQNGAIVSVESLGGKELDWYFRFINEGVEHISPSPRIFITQIGLEPVLAPRSEAARCADPVRVGGRGRRRRTTTASRPSSGRATAGRSEPCARAT